METVDPTIKRPHFVPREIDHHFGSLSPNSPRDIYSGSWLLARHKKRAQRIMKGFSKTHNIYFN